MDEESRWEDRKLWEEEKRREGRKKLSRQEINDIKADEIHDDRENKS